MFSEEVGEGSFGDGEWTLLVKDAEIAIHDDELINVLSGVWSEAVVEIILCFSRETFCAKFEFWRD